jgi:hypothetical protein
VTLLTGDTDRYRHRTATTGRTDEESDGFPVVGNDSQRQHRDRRVHRSRCTIESEEKLHKKYDVALIAFHVDDPHLARDDCLIVP